VSVYSEEMHGASSVQDVSHAQKLRDQIPRVAICFSASFLPTLMPYLADKACRHPFSLKVYQVDMLDLNSFSMG